MQGDRRAAPSDSDADYRTLTFDLPQPGVREKMDLLLRAFERTTNAQHPGAEIPFHHEKDCVLAWAQNGQELAYFIGALAERGVVQPIQRVGITAPTSVVITPAGFDHLAELEKRGILANQGFIAMSFADDLRPLYHEGIKPAIEAAGYKAYLEGERAHQDFIDAHILNMIRDSRFVVADATNLKQNVYFEAGYARGLGKPVFWTAHKDVVERRQLAFDTEHFLHRKWSAPSDLAKQLAEDIIDTIGRGPEPPPDP